MATVVKNFRIKSGLVVEGTTGTIGGQNILTETGGDAYILNLVGGATLVKSVEATQLEVSGAGKLSVKANVFDSYGSASAAQDAAALDATNKADSAQSAAQAFATSADTALYGTVTSDIATAKSEATAAAATDATTKADAAKAAAESTAASALSTAISTEVSNRNNAIATAKSEAISAAEDYTDNAVAGLVGTAPAVLDTIQELATALENNPDIIADLESVAAGKQDTLTAGSNIDITGSTISVTGLDTADVSEDASRLYFTNQRAIDAGDGVFDGFGAASAAQTAAEGYADGLVDNMLDGTTAFTEINVNSEAKQIAATSASLGSVVVTAYEWAKADYRSGKFLVKIDNGTHNEVSEILVTLDSSDNVAITEYAIVGTNGSRGTITATVSGANVQLRVDPVNDSTIKVSGTLLK